ncbi:MAG TPA: hypothetical protein VNG29_01660 [Candidatus Paceibacterota bacterium]|nr:hypothetical protein [Candidatus Paceibacterota bacterium]
MVDSHNLQLAFRRLSDEPDEDGDLQKDLDGGEEAKEDDEEEELEM